MIIMIIVININIIIINIIDIDNNNHNDHDIDNINNININNNNDYILPNSDVNNIILCDEYFKIRNHANDNNYIENKEIANIKMTNNNKDMNNIESDNIQNNPFSLLEQSITLFPPKKIFLFFENLKEFGITSELISQKKHENLAILLEENILRSLMECSASLEHSLRSSGIFPREKENKQNNKEIDFDIEKINNCIDDYLKICTKLINNLSSIRGPWNLITKKNKIKFHKWIQDPITIFAIQYREEFYAIDNYGKEGSLQLVGFNAEHSLRNKIPFRLSSTLQPINSEKIKLKINLNLNSNSEFLNKIDKNFFRESEEAQKTEKNEFQDYEVFSLREIKSKTDFLFSLGKFGFSLLSRFSDFQIEGDFNFYS